MTRSLAYLKRWIVALVKRSVRKMGYELVSDSAAHMTMDGGLARLKKRGIPIATVIDVGASNGRWSEMCMKYFGGARYHLLEAQEEYESQLRMFSRRNSNVSFALKVASDKAGRIYFDDHIVGGGIASREKMNDHFRSKDATSIDLEVAKENLRGPFLVKLDTHGFETSILEGARETLAATNALVIECYNFDINPSAKRFSDMVKYMEGLGFRCIDIVDLSLREKDLFLWQMDVFFARSDLGNFSDTSYN